MVRDKIYDKPRAGRNRTPEMQKAVIDVLQGKGIHLTARKHGVKVNTLRCAFSTYLGVRYQRQLWHSETLKTRKRITSEINHG